MMKPVLQHDEIDQLLSQEDEICPSPSFASSVMGAVRREAAIPPPIPFPWNRALPGLVVGTFVLTLVLVAVVLGTLQLGKTTAPQFSMSLPSLVPLVHGGLETAANWTMLALLAAFVSIKLSVRLALGSI